MEPKKKVIDFISRSALPIVLGCIIANMVVQCYYFEQTQLFTLLFAVASVALFVLYDVLKKRRLLGSLLYASMIAGIGFLTSKLVKEGWEATRVFFTDWFYLNRDTAGFNIYYFLAVYIFGGFFLISIIYYFTQIRFRSLGLMLCLLFPFVIYAKRADIMSNYEVTLIITVFLAIVVHNRLQENKQHNVLAVHDLAYVVTVALFVSAAGAVAMLLPKPQVRSVLERDSHAFDITPFNNNSQAAYSKYTQSSSARYGASYTGEILFYMESDYKSDVYYLKRQSFDSFYDEEWHGDRTGEKYTNYDYYSRINIDRQQYYNSIKAIADTGRYQTYGLSSEQFTLPDMAQYSFRVFDDKFKGVYVPTPLGVIAKTFSESLSDKYYMYGDGEIAVKNVDLDYDYTVYYYPQTPQYVNFAEQLGLSGDAYYSILCMAREDGISEADDLIDQYEMAVENYTGDIEYSPRMAELAHQITDKYSSDYAKAKALETYFENGEFTYDVDYYPEDTSIDYFLFEGKTGSCTSYATSMAMMARIIGLPARYVEGFAAYERMDDGSIAVRDSNAHAFVEVFIPGAGWIEFDPTIPGYMAEGTGGGGISMSSITEYLGRVFVFIAVLFFVLIVVMLDRILELVFRVRLRFTKGDKRMISLYARVKKLLEFSGGDDLASSTANMLTEYAEENNKADIRPIAELFERTCFGGMPLEDQRFAEVYAHYRHIYKYLRKRPKPPKAEVAQAQ
ncbi:MAG: hypothetical protein IKN17_03695 [Ruminococcus sp.]|nr:hypothetical protein [Ruminococcus sp.]